MSEPLSELLVSVLDDYLIDQAETMDREVVIARVAALEAELEKALGVISMLEHHWISPMEYYEATEELNARLSKMEDALDFAYHLRFVDDSNPYEEQMKFWTDVEVLIGRVSVEAPAGESDE